MGNQKYKARHLLSGLCIECSNEVKPHYIRCEDHLNNDLKRHRTNKYKKQHREVLKRRRLKSIKENRCYHCNCPLLDDDKLRCSDCNSSNRDAEGTHIRRRSLAINRAKSTIQS